MFESDFVTKITPFVPFAIIFFAFYFFLVRPQNKRKKAMQEMIDNLKIGDHVVTHSGIIGSISSIDQKNGHIKIETDKNTKIQVLKQSIVRVQK